MLEPEADGFRNYLPGSCACRPRSCWSTGRSCSGLTAPEMTVLVGGLRVLGANHGERGHGVLHRAPGPADQRLLRQPARHDQRLEGGRRQRRRGISSAPTARAASETLARDPHRPGVRLQLASCARSPRSMPRRATSEKFVQRLRQGLDQGDERRPVRSWQGHRALTRDTPAGDIPLCRHKSPVPGMAGGGVFSARDRPVLAVPRRLRSAAPQRQPSRAGRFHGMRRKKVAIPHHPVAPANNKPAPTNPDSSTNSGAIKEARITPASTSPPATI